MTFGECLELAADEEVVEYEAAVAEWRNALQ
jgi:hypothetical protein